MILRLRPDGLTRAEHAAWRQLVEQALTAAATGAGAQAWPLKALVAKCWATPVPMPRTDVQVRLFYDLCIHARAFAKLKREAREKAAPALRFLAQQANEILGPPEPADPEPPPGTSFDSAVPKGDRE